MVISIHDAEEDLAGALSTSTPDPWQFARDNWGPAVVNRTDLFDPYWLQFPPPGKPILYILGVFVGVVGILSVVGNGIVCYTFLRYGFAHITVVWQDKSTEYCSKH